MEGRNLYENNNQIPRVNNDWIFLLKDQKAKDRFAMSASISFQDI